MSAEAATYFSNASAAVTEFQVPSAESFPIAVPSGKELATCPAAAPAKEHSDEDLLLQLGQGDKTALSLLFRRHARAVFSVAYRILRDESEADDLVQDLFLFLFQKARLFDATKSSGASWIIQMTYQRAIDRWRHLDVRHHYNSHEFQEERLHQTNGRISIDEIAGRELLNRLRGHLSPEQRQTLELHLFEGYSFHEIAKKTGQTFGNVRHHYYRSLERLRSYVFPEKHA